MMVLVFCLVFLFSFTPVKAADYTLFARHPFSEDFILPNTEPSRAEITKAVKLTMFAMRGEYESTSFAIYNYGLDSLANVNVSLDRLIKGSDSIDASKVKVSVVKVMEKRRVKSDSSVLILRPEVLIPYQKEWIEMGKFDVAAKNSKQWWVDIKVDEDVNPGLYTGTITIQPSNADSRSIAVELEVAEAQLLVDKDQYSGLYYYPYRTNGGRFSHANDNQIEEFRQTIKADLSLMQKMGLQTVTVRSYFNYDALKSEDDHIDPKTSSYFRAFLQEAKKRGLAEQPLIVNTPPYHVFYNMVNNCVVDSRYTCTFTEEEIRQRAELEYIRFLQLIDGIRIELGLPEFYWYPVDEPFQDCVLYPEQNWIDKRKTFSRLVKLIRRAFPGKEVKIWTTLSFATWFGSDILGLCSEGWFNEIDNEGVLFNDYFNIQVYAPGIYRVGMEEVGVEAIANHLRDSGDIGFMYLNPLLRFGDNLTAYDNRIDHGLYLWSMPFIKGNVPWTYQAFCGDPFNDVDMDDRGGDLTDLAYAYPNPYKNFDPLPSLNYLGVREGVDDLRYFSTLKKAIETSSASQAKKKEASNLLNFIKARTSFGALDYTEALQERVTLQMIDGWRKQIAVLIIELGQPPVPTPTPASSCPNGLSGNLNCDSQGLVDGIDLSIFLANWHPNPPAPTPKSNYHSADLNSDNKVDGTDLSILLSNWRP